MIAEYLMIDTDALDSYVRVADLQQKAFERYQEVYAHFYENNDRSGKPPLGINTVEKHNPYIKSLKYLRITDKKTIQLSIAYELDPEHGLEFKFVGNRIVAVGGIADT